MCISVEPGDFNHTYIADFSATAANDTDRILSYMNEVQAPGNKMPPYLARNLGRGAVTETLPNAMLFAVYGDDVEVLPCEDPDASRNWMLTREGTYREEWTAVPKWTSAMRGGFSFGEPEIVQSGNYNVSIAQDISDIPLVLAALKKVSPGKVPDVSPEILDHMQQYYRMQQLGVPKFVVAAFALEQGGHEDMHPITVRYSQMASVRGKVVLPALDYHGEGEWEGHVKRDHQLYVSTNRLNNLFAPVMAPNDYINQAPAELPGAPVEFPIHIADSRDSRAGTSQDTWAPNSDYVIDTEALADALEPAAATFSQLGNSDIDRYERQEAVENTIRELLGDDGVMAFTNQPVTTAAAYRAGLRQRPQGGFDPYDF